MPVKHLSLCLLALLSLVPLACSDDPDYTYTVTFNSLDATSAAVPGMLTVDYPAICLASLPTPPRRTGYDFGGWFTGTNGAGTACTTNMPVKASLTVYPRWDTYSHTVTFDSQGATTAPVPSGMTVASPATRVASLPADPRKTCWLFGGWYTLPIGAGVRFTTNTTITGPMTAYALWTGYSYLVTFDGQGATTAANPSTVTVASPAIKLDALPADPKKPGYRFGGWFSAPNGAGTAITTDTVITNTMTACARWDAYSYTLTFDGDGATTAPVPASMTVATPDWHVAALPSAPRKTGYLFGGWYTQPNGAGSEFTADTLVTGSATIYAKWNTYNYPVTFDGQGATTEASPATMPVASPAVCTGTLPTPPIKLGYIFGGWYTEPAGGGVAFTAGTTVTNARTVYARWNSYSCTITFDSQSATTAASPSSITVSTPNWSVGTLPTQPVKNLYGFEGWYTGPNRTGTRLLADTVVTNSFTVYAAWGRYTVSYNANGALSGTVPASFTGPSGTLYTVAANSGNLSRIPAEGAGEAFFYGGWNTASDGSGTTYAAGTGQFTLTQNMVLYANLRPFAVKERGPAGGWVVYDKGSFSDGWRYIEVAPADTKTTFWGNFGLDVCTVDRTAYGSGKQNTLEIVANDPSTNTAADACANYTVTSGGIVYSNWYLPAHDELASMWLNRTSDSGYVADRYWSSTEYATWSGGIRDFSNGNDVGDAKTMDHRVRAIRYF